MVPPPPPHPKPLEVFDMASALAPTFETLVVARMIGGLGVGASLIIAPMYIAEIAPPEVRGQLVSFNQLNIVIGITVAFFTNYLILQIADADAAWSASLGIAEAPWRWMLGLETLPAVLYFVGLFFVPETPRFLAKAGNLEEAKAVMVKLRGDEAAAQAELDGVIADIRAEKAAGEAT